MNSRTQNMPLAVLVDFDGTITTRDIGDQVVIKFAEPGWEGLMDLYRAGELNVQELWEQEMRLLRKEREAETVAHCLDIAKIREGFGELVSYCYANDVPIEVASSGIHFYVDAILEKHGFGELPRARPEVDYDDNGHGFTVLPTNLHNCGMTMMCKCDRVWRLRRAGYRVIFVGDGVSDACAVTQADVVLATGSLQKDCDSKGIEYLPFDTFHQVLDALKSESVPR